MLRIIYFAVLSIFHFPGWIYRFIKYGHIEKYSLQERYDFIRKDFVMTLVKHSRVKIVCTGTEYLPQENGYLLTPNHQGLFDALIMVQTHEKPITAVAKIVSQVIRILEARLMDRSNLRSSMKVIHAVTKDLKEGKNYVIFPEGTRSKQGNQLGEFKSGSYKSAIDAKAPIVPVALVDCFAPLDGHSLKKMVAQVHYLKPLYYEDYQDMSSLEIAQYVKKQIEDKITEVKSMESKEV